MNRYPRLRFVLIFSLSFLVLLALAATGSRLIAATNDNNVEWNGLFADQGPLYMNPIEPAATDQVALRFRVYKGDITSANIKYYDTADSNFHWAPMVWEKNDPTGTFDFWIGVVPASPSLKYYRFQINDGTATAWYNALGPWTTEPTSGDFWIVPGFHTPTWTKNAVYYQIFPDRFFDGDPSNNLTFTSSTAVPLSGGTCPAGSYALGNFCAYQHNSWSELPENPPNGEDFFGGDLAGITAKIDPYLKGTLGVNALYLNPIFQSPSNHKYDTQNYILVDPHFGTNADLQTLISTAHTGSGTRMSVMLDGVFNHTSTFNQWFNQQNLYSTPGAYQSQSSQWSDRYVFLNWPTSYCDWAGYASLPKLNYSSSSLRDDIYRTPGSVMQTYLLPPYSIDGWRYDVAGDLVSITSTPSAGSCGGTDNHAIWQDIRPYVKGVNPEALMMGEEWGNPNAWMHGNEWDSAMNYNGFNIPISEWLTCQNVHGENPGQCLSVSQFDSTLRGTLSDNPRPTQLVLMNSLTTHDTSRFLFRAGGDTSKMSEAIIMQMTYVGPPSIYYGDEIGTTGGNDPDNRRTFDWNTSDWNMSLLNLYQKLIQTRKQVSALRDGSFKSLVVDDTNNLYSFGRFDDANWAVVALNNDANAHTVSIPAVQMSIPDGTTFTDALSGATYTVSGGAINVPALASHTGIVLVDSPVGGTGIGLPVAPTGPTPTFIAPTNIPTPVGPSSVVIAGSMQNALGCANSWDPACTNTALTYVPKDDVWQGTYTVPAGNWEYKAALNGNWNVNYGLNATQNGANIPLNLSAPTTVTFYYDNKTHWITSSVNSLIVTAPGTFQSILGCPGDWAPDCLRAWLEDPTGSGTYTLLVNLPAGAYQVKAAINESWTLNYGAGGVQNGPNIPFSVTANGTPVLFSFDPNSHLLSVNVGNLPPTPTSTGAAPTVTPIPPPSQVVVPGSMQTQLGCANNWDPACANTALTYDSNSDVWDATFAVPAGNWEYKVALNGNWNVNYGQNATPGGANIPLNLANSTSVKFYFDNKTHWITSNANSQIVVAAGDFQNALGCSNNWAPDCLRSWLEDPTGSGTYSFQAALPAGNYQAKAALYESWSLNYGAGGAQNGANIPFNVPSNGTVVTFSYDPNGHVLTISVPMPPTATPTATFTLTPSNTPTFTPTFTPTPSFDSLKAKIAACVSDSGIQNSLLVKINADALSDFISEVKAQSGKKISATCADQMTALAQYLLSHPTPHP
ncbi:MAG TPA: alpha-amylase family glycosyl hydrolase [Aggregatilineales bacterium]|nr:alpha-amylase family glycosyl hydrolase [Aggregatilineales bacterium]